ncbi:MULTISPECIES: ABC transporter ATP-binding protein [Corynebacterium]|uniref:ABC transporter ATP-binding protein n=1 Tax=Corynebacterium TaxID=1716 RepID=UPI00124F6274|nr:MULTISPECIES: ABC transporter ATP-binding protein [Corynebacterium]MBV7282482.1 ABC transporter ATP-binding protein [Corynebacterium sp. TAE3-ERU30]MBV7302172.1 ABC transporter ATP-binding protein [Corynebacterium sp. TAE3-ERU2]
MTNTSSCPTITLRDVCFSYPGSETRQLDNFNLEAPAGECTALLGPSGCAKTTALRLIAGLEQPSSGSVYMDETLLAGPGVFVPPEKRAIGLVFQDYALFPHLTVRANIAFGLRKMNRADTKDRVQAMLAAVGLEGYDKRYPHELSGGQQQRVALARALAPSPRVLLLDEPFSNLDTALRGQVRDEVAAIIEQYSVTSVLVTHDEQDSARLAQHTVRMTPVGS